MAKGLPSFLLTFLCLLTFSFGDQKNVQLQEQSTLPLNTTQYVYGCTYTVVIRTSCSSPIYTRDAISIAFGDAYGNQVYAPRLDNPWYRTFERCSTDSFAISGPCAYQICYLYLYRSGYDGWKPETVTIYPPNSRAVTFYYNMFLPGGVWYGFNLCGRLFSLHNSSRSSAI